MWARSARARLAGCRTGCAGRCRRRGRRRTGSRRRWPAARRPRDPLRRPVDRGRPPRPQPYSGHGGRQVKGPSRSAPEAAPPTEEEREQVDAPEQAEPEQLPSPPPRVVVPRWIQLVALPLAALALYALARAAGKVLLIFMVAGVIALILNPAVAFLQRDRKSVV